MIKYLPLFAIFIASPLAAQSFTTADEVRPILEATKPNWVAVREFDGQDLVYITQLLSWRCGLESIAIGLNGDAPAIWEVEPCYDETPTPNAIKAENILPYKRYPLGSVAVIDVVLTYDDGTETAAQFDRKNVMSP